MKWYTPIFFAFCFFFAWVKYAGAQSIQPGILGGSIAACQGAQSANEEVQFFSVSGTKLTGNITATVSPGFVISNAEYTGFADTVSLSPGTNGAVNAEIYIRSAPASAPGNIDGTVTLSSPGVQSRYMGVSAKILIDPVADTEKNITVLNGTTIPRLNFEGTGNTYIWTNSSPDIGLAANGVDSLPTFRALNSGSQPITATITITPVWAGLVYTRDATANAVHIINCATNMLDTSVLSGGNQPVGQVLTSDYDQLWIANKTNLSRISTANLRQSQYFDQQDSYAIGIALSPDDSLLYEVDSADVAIYDSNTGARSSAPRTNVVGGTGFAINPAGNEVYASGQFLASTAGFSLSNIPGGVAERRIPFAVNAGATDLILAPDTSRVFMIQDGAIFVFIRADNAIGQVFQPPVAAEAMALSPDGNTLYVTGNDRVMAFYAADFSLRWQLFLQISASSMEVAPDGTRLYIMNGGSAAVINTLAPALVATIPLANNPVVDPHTISPGSCYGSPVSFTITVNPAPLPTITENGSLNALTTVYGTPSASESFTVSGTILRAGILVTPPAGFEVSLDDINFSPTVTAGSAGTLQNTVIYVRLKATDNVGNYTGHIVLSSPGAANVTVDIPKSTVTPADLVITADDITKAYGAPLPQFPLTYTGFKNGDGPAQLVYPAVTSTTATQTSPQGKYPITVTGAYSENYDISFVPGVLTIVPNIIIPNTFTPNGDGINDTWVIEKIADYPNCNVKVFNRDGSLVYNSTGYSIPWDGTYKGSPLPAGAYYYVINLNADVPLLSGFVAILR